MFNNRLIDFYCVSCNDQYLDEIQFNTSFTRLLSNYVYLHK